MKQCFHLTSLMIALSLVIGCSKEDTHPQSGSHTQQITYSNPAQSSQPTNSGSHPGKPHQSNSPVPPSHNGVAANCNSCHKGMMKDVIIRTDEILAPYQPLYNSTIRFSKKDKIQ